MKKYFMFVAVAAAGMLASCSSESLTAGSDPIIEPTPTQEERVPIQLGVSSPSVDVSRATTRGTGTVGGVGTSANAWDGQRIHAFMFKTGTLTIATETDGTTELYNDAEMITPGSGENVIPQTGFPDNAIGEAMLSNGDIKYYPPSENYDFFAYHGDNAVAASSVDDSDDPWVVPFTIDGSQDLMSTKAALFVDAVRSIDQVTAMGGSTDYYSAKAARKGVQPILKFDHLLTRLSFVIKAGDENAAGWDGSAQVAADAVKVNSIEVYSKTKGKMAVAWTSAPTNMITWDAATTTPAVVAEGAPTWLALKDRPAYYELANPTNYITATAYDALPAGTPGKADYAPITTNVQNYDLIALTPTIPAVHADGGGNMVKDETPVGEALIVAPSTEDYNLRVNVSQTVKTNWLTGATETKTMNYELPIPAPAGGGFLANTSYKVVLTVYGFERIQVTTVIIPWDENTTPIEVGQD